MRSGLCCNYSGGAWYETKEEDQESLHRSSVTELQSRLCNLCEDRSLGRKSIADFFRGVSHNLRGGQPNI